MKHQSRSCIASTMKHHLLSALFFCYTAYVALSVNPICKDMECPPYHTIHMDTERGFTIRKYNQSVWISTKPIEGYSFEKATNLGFERIQKYIRRGNKQGARAAMTDPLVTKVYPSRGPLCIPEFKVEMFMPSQFQKLGQFPQPHERLSLVVRRHGATYAAVRSFNGSILDNDIAHQASYLQAALLGTPWARAMAKTQDEDPSLLSFALYGYSPRGSKPIHKEVWFLFHMKEQESFKVTQFT